MVNKIINHKFLILLLLVLAAGVAVVWWVAQSTDKRMRAILLEKARIAAQAINIQHVISLSGSEKDLGTPDYIRIKSQLTSMRNAMHQCRFLYLMGQRSDGAVFFFVDSLPVDSEDYALPGLVYNEVPDSYLRIFATKQKAVVGPVTDRWGTLTTALVPLTDPQTKKIVAVLGMDVDANEWNKRILYYCLLPFTAMLFLAVLILLLAYRELAVKALQESEEKHRLFFENAPIGILHYDKQGIITDANEAVVTTFGSSREKLIELDINDIPNKKFTNEIYKSLNGEIGYYEGEYTSYIGGKTSTIKANGIPIFHDGDVIAGVGIVEDITERTRVEEALRKSEEKYRELADSLPQTIFEIDETGRIVYANQTAFDLFKYTKDEFDKGINISQIIIPEDHDRALKNMQSILNGIQLGGIEYTVLRHDGTTFPAVIHSSLTTRNAKPIGLRGLLIDISDQKKMEEKLKKSEERYREYFEDNIVGAYISSPGGKLIACNREYKKIFGFDSTQQALDTTISKIFEVPNERAEFLRLLKKKKRVTGYESKLRKINGTPIRMLENASGVFDEEGNLKRIRGFLMDVTEQRKLEAQLRQAQRMETIGTLAGGIAHDFNNILFPILGHADMLLADIPEDSPLQDGLNEISAGALRAKDLVRQILTFSRQDTTELILMKMQPIIKEALKLIRSTIPTTIDITQDINADCGAIKADPTQLHQIIMNLTTNAFHAMEETGGVLSVSLKEIELGNDDVINLDLEPGTYVCLTIADTGTGMDKNIIEKIFDPFFTTKEVGKGTGMGLSVVHGIIKSMKGAIQVYSEPGKGAEFRVCLPVEQSSFERQSIQIHDVIQSGTEQILFVDDEAAIITMGKRMLERLGYQVTSRTSSLEALEAFRANPDRFDLVITDMAMPNMPGDKLSTELIKIRSDIPVLLCTGFSENISEKKAASLGIKGFILKPIVMKDLARKIREVLDNNNAVFRN